MPTLGFVNGFTGALKYLPISIPFGLLTDGSRTALPRQRTLRALIDWSYDLLSDAEKASNKEMTLCCSRARTPYLVVDL